MIINIIVIAFITRTRVWNWPSHMRNCCLFSFWLIWWRFVNCVGRMAGWLWLTNWKGCRWKLSRNVGSQYCNIRLQGQTKVTKASFSIYTGRDSNPGPPECETGTLTVFGEFTAPYCHPFHAQSAEVHGSTAERFMEYWRSCWDIHFFVKQETLCSRDLEICVVRRDDCKMGDSPPLDWSMFDGQLKTRHTNGRLLI